MNDLKPELRNLFEQVRCEVMALLAKTKQLDLDTLYKRVREGLGEDTDMAVAGVVSALLRAHVICMEPLFANDPNAGMYVSMAEPLHSI